MKKTTPIFSLALGLTLLFTACSGTNTTTPTDTPTPGAQVVVATAHVVPNQSVYLSFLASGRVSEVLVKKGDQVTQGQVLARLGDREQAMAALAGAVAQSTAAQQGFDALTRSAGLVNAQAWLAYMNAQKAHAAAQLAWDRLDLSSLQSDIDTAQADATSRQTDLLNAQTDLAKYNTLPADNPTRQSYEDKVRTAQTNLDSAVQKLLDLTNSRDAVHAALDSATAVETEARRTYENSLKGPDPDKLALAQAALNLAKAQTAAAQSALENYDLKAPFAGTVANVNISAFQLAGPQTWAVALADTSQMYVDTSDLTEMDVVKVSVGQTVKVTADALPGVTMDGVVESISSAPVLTSGDVTYPVHILLKNPAPALLWGMTTEVTFAP